jgi:3-methyl-2-oxobutanoate hydroxymethyltransferase
VVKLERGGTSASRAAAIVAAGIPVIGHLGLTPQTEVKPGGRRAEGRTAEKAGRLLQDGLALQRAGCFAPVLEAVAAPVASLITKELQIPTIGMGAGAQTSGQALVWHDLLGLYDWRPRFARAFAELRPAITEALRQYAADVRARSFPSDEHAYTIPADELSRLLESFYSDD